MIRRLITSWHLKPSSFEFPLPKEFYEVERSCGDQIFPLVMDFVTFTILLKHLNDFVCWLKQSEQPSLLKRIFFETKYKVVIIEFPGDLSRKGLNWFHI